MRLIDADAIDLDREVELADDWKTAHEIAYVVKYAPTVDAVPLDKLCEWLEKNATMDCDGCRATIGSCEDDDVNEKVCNSRERWKIMLTKWMEGQK